MPHSFLRCDECIVCVCSCCELYIRHMSLIYMYVVWFVHIPYVRYIVCLCVLCSWYMCMFVFSRLYVICDMFDICMVYVGVCLN